MRAPWTRLVIVAALLAGCATLPPAKPVQDFKALSGTWTGSIATQRVGTHSATMTINPDGTFVVVAPTLPPGTFKGTAQVAGGKVQFKGAAGRTGTWTLHEGNGQRILVVRMDDETSEARYTPKP